MAPKQALRELTDKGLYIAQTDDVGAAVLPLHFKMITHSVKPGGGASLLNSLPYQIALAVLERSVGKK